MKHASPTSLAALVLLAAPNLAHADPASRLGANMAYAQMGSMARSIASDPEAFLDHEAQNDEAMRRRLAQIKQALDNDEAKLKSMAEINAKSVAAGNGLVFDKGELAADTEKLARDRASLKDIADYTSYRMPLAKEVVKDLADARKGGHFDEKTDFSNNDNYDLEHKMGVFNWIHAYDKRVVKNKFSMYYLDPIMGLVKPMNKKFPVGGAEIPKGEGFISDVSLAGECARVKVPADAAFLANFDKNFGTKDGLKILCEKGSRSFTAKREESGETEVKIGYNSLPWPMRHAPDPKGMVKDLRKAAEPEAGEEAVASEPAAAEPAHEFKADDDVERKQGPGSISVDATLD